MFKALDGEMYIAKRLREHGVGVFEGLTTAEQRKQRVREAINAAGPAVIIGRGKDRRTMTYAEAFEALYGEPL